MTIQFSLEEGGKPFDDVYTNFKKEVDSFNGLSPEKREKKLIELIETYQQKLRRNIKNHNQLELILQLLPDTVRSRLIQILDDLLPRIIKSQPIMAVQLAFDTVCEYLSESDQEFLDIKMGKKSVYRGRKEDSLKEEESETYLEHRKKNGSTFSVADLSSLQRSSSTATESGSPKKDSPEIKNIDGFLRELKKQTDKLNFILRHQSDIKNLDDLDRVFAEFSPRIDLKQYGQQLIDELKKVPDIFISLVVYHLDKEKLQTCWELLPKNCDVLSPIKMRAISYKLHGQHNPEYTQCWAQGSNFLESSRKLFQPISSIVDRLLSGHFKTRGGDIANLILKNINLLSDNSVGNIQLLLKMLNEQLEKIDKEQDLVEKRFGSHPRSFGETAMRIKFAIERLENIANPRPVVKVLRSEPSTVVLHPAAGGW